eukprot:scaffold96_cov167-Ochromonas_danica.AAC.57
MVDKMTATAVGLLFVPIVAYIIDFILQYRGLQEGAERIAILNIRVALFLPFYAFFMMIGCAAPRALPALNIPLNLVESYSFYCFFVLLVSNLGGSNAFVNAMNSTNKTIFCCNPCCPKDNLGMYNGARSGLWHLIITRNVITVIAAICDYSGSRAGKALYAVLSVVLLLKFSIGLIVFEGLICQFMIAFNKEPYDDDSDWNAEEKTSRAYCSLVLVEYAVLTLPYILLWAAKVNAPASTQTDKSVTTAPLTFCGFLGRVWAIWDIFGLLPVNSDLDKPLAEANAIPPQTQTA